MAAALRFFGEPSTYGLREIKLASEPGAEGGQLRFGRLLVPGKIVLFPQPRSPWRLPGRVGTKVRRRLRRAGALVEIPDDGVYTLVEWPGNTLREFVLLDVLMHEIGHHLIQHYKGKRRDRVARTRDHEAFADHFSRRCRSLYGKAHPSDHG